VFNCAVKDVKPLPLFFGYGNCKLNCTVSPVPGFFGFIDVASISTKNDTVSPQKNSLVYLSVT
jgi:hypothetical protein